MDYVENFIKQGKFMNLQKWYCDGACSGNPGPGGWAAVRLTTKEEGTYINYKFDHVEDTTNNRMELTAILYVLNQIERNIDSFYLIYSDSAYVVNICQDWIWKWAENDWRRSRNKPIENLDLIKKIYNLLKGNNRVKIEKVNGHAGVLGNELADALAANNKAKFDKLIKENDIII